MNFAFLICGKACVWLGESELSESAGFQDIFESALYFVEGLFVSREIGDSLIIVFCSMTELGWLDLSLT